jgi:hypothetical protein
VIKAVSEDDADAEFTPCPHTLFIASDHGCEYRSAAFDQSLGIEGMDDDEVESHNYELYDDLCGIDGITDKGRHSWISEICLV